ncbi:MAG TPA: hypothetical protein PKY73_00285 [Hyphomonas sp.]|nr:hypothetical protein [Hyphomonas sp.]
MMRLLGMNGSVGGIVGAGIDDMVGPGGFACKSADQVQKQRAFLG